MTEPADIQKQRRAAIARTARDIKRNPADDEARTRLADLRAEYAEEKIARYVKTVVDKAPPLGEERAKRLSVLLGKR